MISFEMEKSQILMMVPKIRREHPRMAARLIYNYINPVYMGRDKFEKICFENGYKLQQKNNSHRTTNSLGVTRFLNLIKDIQVTGVNQVLVSDITYYRIGERFYYLTFIMDLFNREIKGYSVSENLLTEETTLPALKMVTEGCKGAYLSGLILHSDGGGQYYSKKLIKVTKEFGIRNSMCETVYENAHAERLNGTIKNYYLIPYGPKNLKELKRMLTKSVRLYNNERPHMALGGLPPARFGIGDKFSTKFEFSTKRKKVTKKEKINYYYNVY
jgi:transposase InsO family protein